MIPELIAVTGGIGVGKSVVSGILRIMGFDVYDSDIRAKHLMDESDRIKHAICDEICREAINGRNEINRRLLAEKVFSDKNLLDKLNRIVHGAVADDLRAWAARHTARRTPVFVETALLYQSGLDLMVDRVWEVTAPETLRIERVMRRNRMAADEVKARIASQDSYRQSRRHPHIDIIVNDNQTAVLPQVERLITQYRASLLNQPIHRGIDT